MAASATPPPAAPSAPSSAPAAPAPSVPAAPPAAPAPPPAAPPAAPDAAPAPAAAPDAAPKPADAAPAAYDPKTAAAPPANTDFPNTPDGQVEFLKQYKEWEKAHPEGVKPADAAPAAEAAKTPEEQALADAQPAPAKPADAPEPAATPQALAEMMEADPAFKAALEASPKAKGQIFSMARELAASKPITEIVPTVEDAKFMQEYSGHMVGLKTASMRMIDSPDSAPQFLELFDSQFQRVDGEGKPILDAAGKPTYDPDRAAVRSAIFNDEFQRVSSPIAGEIEALNTKLAGAYPSEFARQQDQQKLDNLEYAKVALEVVPQIIDGTFFEGAAPEPPADATEEQKQWFAEQKANLDRQKQELDDKKKGASKEERASQTQQFQTAVREDMGTAAGTIIHNAMKSIVDTGVYIPEFYLQEKYVDPGTGKETGTSAIGARLFLQFENELMKPGSRALMEQTQHELLPQNDQTKEIRKTWYARKAAELIPALVQKEVDRIQSLVKLDQDKQDARLKERNKVAQPEPSTGGSSLPAGASREQVLSAAEEAAKKDPGWAASSPTEKQARILTQVHRMQKK